MPVSQSLTSRTTAAPLGWMLVAKDAMDWRVALLLRDIKSFGVDQACIHENCQELHSLLLTSLSGNLKAVSHL